MGDPITPALLNPVAKRGVDKLLDVVTQVWSYRDYITSLQSDTGPLRSRLSDVQREVTDARSSGLDLTVSIQDWLQEGKAKLAESDQFLQSLDPAAPKCWKLSCDWNCKSRYDTATRAEALSKEINTLMGRYPNEPVWFEPRPPPLGPSFAEAYLALPSREMLLKGLQGLLSEKLVVGVHGTKGAGKTALVRKLAVDIDSGGELRSVVVTGSEDAKDIQQGIVERILGRPLNLQTTRERARSLHHRLVKIGKVVFIIDDVAEKIDLRNEIGIPWPDANNGCRIVVVSRSSTVCKRMKTEMNLEVGPLWQDEPLDLFDHIVKGLHFTTSSGLQEARDHISSSKQAWFPGEIEAYIGALHSKPLLPTRSVVASSQSRDRKFMVGADELQIEHGDNPQHWRTSLNPNTSCVEAQLIQVWYLDIKGKATRELLWHATKYYGAYLVYKLMPNAQGFKTSKVEFIVNASVRSCFLDPSKATAGDFDSPKTREDGWLEIEMGSFYYNEYTNPEVDLLIRDHDCKITKSGLFIRGIELRPLDQI